MALYLAYSNAFVIIKNQMMRGKKTNRGEGDCSQLLEKLFVYSYFWWRLSTRHFRANFNSWVQLMPLCKFSDCVLSLCVPHKNSGLTNGFLQIFKEHVGNSGVQGRIIRALLGYFDRTKSYSQKELPGFSAQQFGL